MFSPNIDEPFEWTKIKGGSEDVYFKSQMMYTYTDAKEYCNRQKIGEKSSGVGIHSSQLWKYNESTETLINKEGIWTSPKDVKWNFEKKGNIFNYFISVTKKPEKKDNKTATSNSKEQVLVENDTNKGLEMVWSHQVDEGKFWLFWNENNGRKVVTSKKAKQRWKKSKQANSGDYFTLEITDAGKFLTAANGSLQIRGTCLGGQLPPLPPRLVHP